MNFDFCTILKRKMTEKSKYRRKSPKQFCSFICKSSKNCWIYFNAFECLSQCIYQIILGFHNGPNFYYLLV